MSDYNIKKGVTLQVLLPHARSPRGSARSSRDSAAALEALVTPPAAAAPGTPQHSFASECARPEKVRYSGNRPWFMFDSQAGFADDP